MSKVVYSKLFVPPKFLERPSVAVEVLSSGVYFLSTKRTEHGLVPDQSGFLPFKKGDIVRGEIIRKEVVTKALEDIRKKTRLSFVRFSIPEEKTYIFKTHLPKLADEEIRSILDFKLEENVPLTSKEAVFDYSIIPAKKHGQGLDLIVSVAPLKFVEEWQAVFASAGLTPVLFSPESNNVAKSVVKENNEQTLVIVNIREENIILSLVVCGLVYQTSSVNFGSSTFTDLLARYYKVSFEEALKLKKEKLYTDNADNMEIFSYTINTLSAIKDEIYKFVSYCNEREDVVGQVDRLILCGQEALVVGLEKYIATNLNITTSIANVWTNSFDLDHYTPELSRLESLDYAVVNGLNLF